jgi:hypothetical protein
MRIAVISPHTTNNGNTTLAMLIALEFASTNKVTCITHIKPMSISFTKYLNFRGFVDKTSSPSQIVKILKEGNLKNDEARDYCKGVNKDLEAFTNTSSDFTQEDMNFMFRYIAKAFPHENVVFDVDDQDPEQIKNVVKLCDVVVLNITQSNKEIEAFRNNKDVYLDICKGKPVVTVVNKFNSVKSTTAEVAKWMGVKKPNNWVVLHENPWIAWATNHGKLNTLFNNIAKKDSRVIELQADMVKICATIAKAKSAAAKQKGGNK